MLKREGRVIMPFGVMGGQYQPNGHARLVTDMVDYGMDVQTSFESPRGFADAGGLKLERGYDDTVRAALAEMGHDVCTPDAPLGGGQAILLRDDGVLEGASDPRKDGMAVGY
jgi:gamma-glutamyltranspeptidase/glutathione hydrolase